MSLVEWYAGREVLLTGISSQLGRALFEKILRSLPNVKVYTVLRSRSGMGKDERIKNIFASPGFERLRQEQPNAIERVKAVEGNLLYDDLGITTAELKSLENIQIVFHAGGPFDDLLGFCKNYLPKLGVLAVATSLFNHNETFDNVNDEKFSGIPLTVLRHPVLAPALMDPMPGFVDILAGPTALMIGAGYAFGRSELTAEIIPIDLAVNGLIAAAWERGTRSKNDAPTIYNMTNIGCTWAELIEKGQMAHRKFPYPTFGICGMTSIALLHWIVVFFLEWVPSAFCDTILSCIGAKPRCVAEYERAHKALQSLEQVTSTTWSVDRARIYQLEKRLSSKDRENYPIHCDIDLETYVLCVAASAKKNCVNEANLKIVKNFKRLFMVLIVLIVAFKIFG